MVLTFARDLNRDLTRLVKEIDAFVKKQQDKDMRAFVVFLTKEPAQLEPRLKALAEAEKISIPLTIYPDEQGPKPYKLNPNVKFTVLVYRDKKVQSNFALPKITPKDTKAILAEAEKMVAEKSASR